MDTSLTIRWIGGFILLILLTIGLYSFDLDFDLFNRLFVDFYPWEVILSNGLIITLSLLLLSLYLWIRKRRLIRRGRFSLFIASVVLIIAVTDKAATLVSPYLVPVGLGVALLVIFLDTEVGLVSVVLFAVLVGLGVRPSLGDALVAFGGGMAALFSVRNIRRQWDLAIAGINIGIVSLFMAAGIEIAKIPFNGVDIDQWWVLGWAAINGPISMLIVTAGMPFAEYLTRKTSPLGLMEYLNPAHPLLERLRNEAPGTYQHSVALGNLGEAAARAIGADPLLTRVGGYYHDIGKLERPEFFIENQESGENPHDELTSNMSKVILTSHVRDGVTLGREYGLREDILQFIVKHHGTTLIRYFFLKALREDRKEGEREISEDEFRYDLSLPDTKETAILLLADGVEAAFRSMEHHSTSQIEDMVHEIIYGRFHDSQLDAAPLTLTDLRKIEEAFVETLMAMARSRAASRPVEPKPAR